MAGASLALRVTGDAGGGGKISVLVGIAGLTTRRSTFEESSSTVDTIGACIDATVAFRVTGLAKTVLAEEVEWAVSDASAIKGEASHTAGAVPGDDVAGSACGIAVGALVDGGFVESPGAVEGADAANHDIGALVIADAVEEDLS